MANFVFFKEDNPDQEVLDEVEKIYSTMNGSKFLIEILWDVLKTCTIESSAIAPNGELSLFDQMIKDELGTDSIQDSRLVQFQSAYKNIFIKFTNKSHPGNAFSNPWWMKINEVRARLLEKILEEFASYKYDNNGDWNVGCTVEVNGYLIKKDHCEKTVDFAGYQNKFCETIECKTSPDAFFKKKSHVEFLQFLKQELDRFSIENSVSCLSLESKSTIRNELKEKFGDEYSTLFEGIKLLQRGDIFRMNDSISLHM